MSGNATLTAATTVRNVLLSRASKHFEEETEALDIVDGKVFVKQDPSRRSI